MPNLYEIMDAKDFIESVETMREEEKETYIKSLIVQEKNKIDNTVKVIRECELNAEACDKEIERLSKLKRHFVSEAERVKEWIRYSMDSHDIEKVETGFTRLSFRKSEQVKIEDESLVPNKFKKEKVTQTIDKLAIKKAIKEGEEIAGVSILTNRNLQIV